MTQLTLLDATPSRAAVEFARDAARPTHLVWGPGDLRAICGLCDPLPRLMAWHRMGHVIGHRLSGRPLAFCPTCRQIAAHDHTAPAPPPWARRVR